LTIYLLLEQNPSAVKQVHWIPPVAYRAAIPELSTMTSTLASAVLLVFFLIPALLLTQDAPQTTPTAQSPAAMPQEPAAFLNAAAKLNGLGAVGSQPWHVKVSYQVFDHKGHPQDTGTFEEFWISDKKYKSSFSSSSFTQSDFATDRGLYRTGNQNWPSSVEMTVRNQLFEPIPVALNLSGVAVGTNRRSVAKVKLPCISLKAEMIYLPAENYCFQADQPILRFTASPSDWNNVSFENVSEFRGHFIAHDIRVTSNGHPHIILHVEEIENLPAANDSDFIPPSDAVRIPESGIILPEMSLTSLLLRQIVPVYPTSAKEKHVDGAVVLQVRISKDGRVTDAQAISGPDALRTAAIDAVRQWQYRPFLILSEPTAIQSTVKIFFTLG
jgi:TonB family protein